MCLHEKKVFISILELNETYPPQPFHLFMYIVHVPYSVCFLFFIFLRNLYKILRCMIFLFALKTKFVSSFQGIPGFQGKTRTLLWEFCIALDVSVLRKFTLGLRSTVSTHQSKILSNFLCTKQTLGLGKNDKLCCSA